MGDIASGLVESNALSFVFLIPIGIKHEDFTEPFEGTDGHRRPSEELPGRNPGAILVSDAPFHATGGRDDQQTRSWPASLPK